MALKTQALGAKSLWDDLSGQRSDESDVLGARPFGATSFFVLDILSHVEGFDAGAFQRRVMEENVTPLPFDEPKPSVCDDLLDRTLRHVSHLSKTELQTSTGREP